MVPPCTCYRSWTLLNWAPLGTSHGHVLPYFQLWLFQKLLPSATIPSFVASPCFFSETDQGRQGFLPWGHHESLGNARGRALVCGGHWAVWAVLEQDLHTHWDTWESFKWENLLCLWSSDFIQTPVFIHRVFCQCPLCSSYLLNKTAFVNVQAVVVSVNTRQKFPYKPPMPPAAPGPTPLMTSKVQGVWDQACGDNITAIIICFGNDLVTHSHHAGAAHWCGNSWILFFF